MSAPLLADALAHKKLRLYWDAALPVPGPTQDAALAGLWAALRQHRPEAPGNSQDETLEVQAISAHDAGFSVRVRYTFDHDFASQYDRTEAFIGEVELDAAGAFVRIARWDPA